MGDNIKSIFIQYNSFHEELIDGQTYGWNHTDKDILAKDGEIVED